MLKGKKTDITFSMTDIEKIKREEDVVQTLGQIVDLIAHLDSFCQRQGYEVTSKHLKISASILVRLIRILIEGNVKNAA